ncbi:MAG: hypothetical protein WCP22_13875 [Chlamydiota bacterium]
MKLISASSVLFLVALVSPSYSQTPTPTPPPWTDFAYTDWNPGTSPAISGSGTANQHCESRSIWDGTQFVSIHGSEEGRPWPSTYWIAYSADGQIWGTPTPLAGLPRVWNTGHHAVAYNKDNFPATDTMNGDTNIKFKMWYTAYGTTGYDYFRYAESPDGITWEAADEFLYCPSYYKVSDWPGNTKVMIKPDVLYRPKGSATLDTANPMNNRYISYLGASRTDASGGPGYFEMYISNNGLDWKLYAWDQQCQDHWDSQPTPVPTPEVSDIITFTGGSSLPSGLNVDALEEVYQNGELQGYMFWVEVPYGPILSYYSTNGVDWTGCEATALGINNIGAKHLGEYWNNERNHGYDSVRLGESYFILRSGKNGTAYTLGAAVRKGNMSAEATPLPWSGGAVGNLAISYALFNWTAEVAPSGLFTYSTDGSTYTPATMMVMGGDGDANLAASIGGSRHVYAWDVNADLPGGAGGSSFRVKPVPASGEGSYDTVFVPIGVNFQPGASPTPLGFVKDSGQAYGAQGWRTYGW